MQFKKTLVSAFTLGALICSTSAVLGQTYYVQPGDSLYSIAARYGITTSALQQINGLGSAPIYPGQALNISSSSPVSASSTTTSSNYTVHSGDTLYLVAQKFGISLADLRSANNLSSDSLAVGQTLAIPSSTTSSSNPATNYRVQSGDTLYLIAQKYKITVAALKSANGLTGDNVWVGQALQIPAVSNGSTSTTSVTYTVKSGDTLFLIAQRLGITISALTKANSNLNPNAPLQLGQVLQIPGSGQSTTSNINISLSQSDTDLLARLVSAESGGEPFNGQVAVAATVLNRLQDPRYPKTIPGIIYEIDNGCYQYSPVLDGRINLPASASAYQAVQTALSGVDPSNGADGFYNPAKTTSQWVRSNPITAVIGNHVFYSY